jgi:hypothetical protein
MGNSGLPARVKHFPILSGHPWLEEGLWPGHLRDLIERLPLPVPCPGISRCWTALLC